MQNNCIECENETMLQFSDLQTDYLKLKEDYKLLNNLYNAMNKHYLLIKEQRDDYKGLSEMWHDDFIEKSKELDIFRNDPYFENLELKNIAELAKKSIRLTSEKCDMIHDFEEMKKLLENIDQSKYGKNEKKVISDCVNLCEKHIICEEI